MSIEETHRAYSQWPLTRRILFGAVLTGVMAAGTFPAIVVGVLGPQLLIDFQLTRVELGVATTLIFLVGGSLSLLVGPAVDGIGAKRLMLASFVILAIAMLGIVSAEEYWVFLSFAGVGGIALALGNPVTNKLVAVHIAPGRRGLTMGTKQAGVQLGAFVAGAFVAPLAVAVGWRGALASSVLVIGFLFVVGALAVPRDPGRLSRGDRREVPVGGGVGWLAIYAFLMGGGVAAIQAYLPLYLVERVRASEAEAGFAVAVIGLVGVASRVVWGWGSERLRSFSLPLIILGAGAALAIVMVLMAEFVGLWLAVVASTLLGATASTWNAVGMLAVLRVSGAREAGRASGIVLFGFFMGFVASPIVFGWLVDSIGTYHYAWLLVVLVFLVASAVAVAWRRRESLARTG